MAIDPRIPLGVTPMQLESPTEQMGKAMNLRTAQAQMQEIDQKQADRDALGRAYSGGVVRQSVLERLKAEAPHLIPLVSKQFDEMDMAAANLAKVQADTSKTQADIAKAESEYVGILASGVAQHGYSVDALEVVLAAATEKFPGFKSGADAVRQQVAQAKGDPEAIKAIVMSLVARSNEAADNVRADNLQAAQMPGVVADSSKKQTEAYDAQLVNEGRVFGAIKALPAAERNAAWQAAIASLPPERQQAYASTPMYSPSRVAFIERAASTAQERIDNAIKQQNANTSAARAAEQKRHNRELEAIARDPLANRERELRVQKLERELAGAAAGSLNEKAEAIRPALDEITALSSKIFDQQGPVANVVGAWRALAAKGNLDDDVKVYRALVAGMTPLIARATGHSGVLTEKDVERTEMLFGTIGVMGTDSKPVAERKIEMVRRLILGQASEEEKAAIRRDLGWEGETPSGAGGAQPSAAPGRIRYDENGNIIREGGG